MANMPQESLVLSFSDDDKEYAYGIKVYVDTPEYKDNDLFSNTETSCKPNEKVNIYVAAATVNELKNIVLYDGVANMGLGTAGTESNTIDENIYFDDKIIAETDKPILSINTATAATALINLSALMPTIVMPKGELVSLIKNTDSSVKISNNTSKVVGSVDLNYTYSIKYKKYVWTAPNTDKETEFPFSVYNNGTLEDTFSINVVPDDEVAPIVDVKLVIKDIANDSIISNANIAINCDDIDNFVEKTSISDENGECVFELQSGKTYQLKVTANGYISSDIDYLNNDSFTVPIPENE